VTSSARATYSKHLRVTSMVSPPRGDKSRADKPHPGPSYLPKRDCRYILLHPDSQGLRYACIGFALNRSISGSTCDCGHQACYHTPDKNAMSPDKIVGRELTTERDYHSEKPPNVLLAKVCGILI
jgi:hypothetical protein